MVLGALPYPVLVVGGDGAIGYVNGAAEQFFSRSAIHLHGRPLDTVIAGDSPLFALIEQVRAAGAPFFGYDVRLGLTRSADRNVAIHAAPLGDDDGGGVVVLSLHERSTAQAVERQMVPRNAARSVTAMALLMAHEVKNPLSGIRGAAQLLEQTANDADRKLTRLICEETDRICTLVERMDMFADDRPPERSAVNIHEVLEHVQRLAEAGFARQVSFANGYDPSLPPVFGNRDQLIQVFLNLVKNAAEAAPEAGGEIHLATAFRSGVRLAVPGGDGGTRLPLVISVTDNGPGIPDDIAPHMFDAFVSGKSGGTGLGLSLVAKIVNDHGGVVEVDTDAAGTTFRVLLPMRDAATGAVER
jgi:two-component system nitrogen regulation sensor histidine kinase GlnL